jgi:hypothetical protein
MAMASPVYFRSAPLRKGIVQRELNFHLYMRQQTEGTPGANEKGVVFMRQPDAFGEICANDWTMYDGYGPRANLVARAQGVHTGCDMNQADSWLVCLNIEFVDERYYIIPHDNPASSSTFLGLLQVQLVLN